MHSDHQVKENRVDYLSWYWLGLICYIRTQITLSLSPTLWYLLVMSFFIERLFSTKITKPNKTQKCYQLQAKSKRLKALNWSLVVPEP